MHTHTRNKDYILLHYCTCFSHLPISCILPIGPKFDVFLIRIGPNRYELHVLRVTIPF